MNLTGEIGEINRNVSLERHLVRSAVFMYQVYKSSLSCPRHLLAILVVEPQLKTCCSLILTMLYQALIIYAQEG